MGEADPSQAVSFAELPNRGLQPAGARLDGRAASWLPGRWRGQATSLTFDEGQPLFEESGRPCVEPVHLDTDHDLSLSR